MVGRKVVRRKVVGRKVVVRKNDGEKNGWEIPILDLKMATLGKVLFETAKTGNSGSVSIAHTQPAAPKLERGGATLARALDIYVLVMK